MRGECNARQHRYHCEILASFHIFHAVSTLTSLRKIEILLQEIRDQAKERDKPAQHGAHDVEIGEHKGRHLGECLCVCLRSSDGWGVLAEGEVSVIMERR
jgi:hypothetical protein